MGRVVVVGAGPTGLWPADVVLDEPLTAPVTASGPDGLLMAVPLPGGACRLVGVDPANRSGTPTLAEVVGAVIRITGSDLGVREARWLSRFGNATRQAATYRRGRVWPTRRARTSTR